MVDRLATNCSVPPSVMKEELFKTLVTFIMPSSEAGAKSLELILRHKELSVQAWNQEFFRPGKVCWSKGTFISISCTT